MEIVESNRLATALVIADPHAAIWVGVHGLRWVGSPLGGGSLAEEIFYDAEAWALQVKGYVVDQERYRRVQPLIAIAVGGHETFFSALHALAYATSNGASCELENLKQDFGTLMQWIARCIGGEIREEWKASRARLWEFARSLKWVLTIPTPDARSRAPAQVQVAWDAVATDPRTDHTIADLLESHARAARLGLDWNNPVGRAIAERATDEKRIAALLAAPSP